MKLNPFVFIMGGFAIVILGVLHHAPTMQGMGLTLQVIGGSILLGGN